MPREKKSKLIKITLDPTKLTQEDKRLLKQFLKCYESSEEVRIREFESGKSYPFTTKNDQEYHVRFTEKIVKININKAACFKI